MFHCTISHVILNSMFEYSANLDLPLQPLLKITDQSASDASVGLSHSRAGRLFTYLGCCRQGNMVGKINPYSPVNLWFDLDKIATETLFVGNDSHTHPKQHIKTIEQSK